MLETIKNVLIIDDNYNEVKGLEEELKKQDIGVLCLNSNQALEKELKPKDLLFLDFVLDNTETEFKTILSAHIRPLLEKHFNKNSPYGIVIWSKHNDFCETFFSRIKSDTLEGKYIAPLFIVQLDKLKYLEKKDFSGILTDLESKLENSISASFFLNWQKGVRIGFNTTVKDIYSFCDSFDKRDEKIKHILYRITKAFSGISKDDEKDYIDNNHMTMDAYKALNEIFFSDVNKQCLNSCNFFKSYKDGKYSYEEELHLAAKINQKKFIDRVNISQKIILPGNVYEIHCRNPLLESIGKPKNATPIAIELTPPCDVVNKKTFSRLVGGFLMEYPSDLAECNKFFRGYIEFKYTKVSDSEKHVDVDKTKYVFPLFNKPSQYLLAPVYLPQKEKPCFILLDFSYRTAETNESLTDNSKYELLFKVKEPLFADILQKYSSHGARLGVSTILI